MKFKRKLKKDASIEIASLIDIVFILLLFFVVTTTFKETPGMEIDLPETRQTAGVEVKDLIVLVGFEDGEEAVFMDDVSIPLEALPARLKEELAKRESEDKQVVVQADKNVKFDLVYKVFDIAREAGALGISIPAEFKGGR